MNHGVISSSENIDQYMNIVRDWRITKKFPSEDILLIIHSGTDGISVATKSSNNGFVHLTMEEVNLFIAELYSAITFTTDSKVKARKYWDLHNEAEKIKKSP